MDLFIFGIMLGLALGFLFGMFYTRMVLKQLRKHLTSGNSPPADSDPANWWKHQRRPYHEEPDEDDT